MILKFAIKHFLFARLTSRRSFSSFNMDCGGLLLSQLNSYQKESFNLVVSCEKIANSNNYLAVLDDTILYPEGGGQPWDLGDVNGKEVLKVLKAPGNNKHVQVELSGPVEVGSSVKSTVNWERRYDHMQQHTSQHVFSAIADKLFKAETVGWGLSPDSVTVDLSLAGNALLTNEQLDEIERETNAFIRTGALVSFKIYKPSDLTNNQDSSDPALEVLRGAPKGAALELAELRMVNVEGLDLNPCGGTHLHSVSEINMLKIIGTEKNRGSLRVRYLAGDRAVKYFGEALAREATLSTKLSVPPTQFVAQVDKLLKERKDNSKKWDVYSEELAGFWGASLAAAAAASDKPNFVVKHRVGADLKFLVKAAESVIAANPTAFVFLSGDEQIPSGAAQQQGGKKVEPLSGPYVVFGDKDAVNKVKAELQTLINGRGGGKPGRMQGVAQNLENIEKLTEYLKNTV